MTAKHTQAATHRVDRVHGHLVLRRITNEALRVSEADVRRCCAVTLVVGDDLDTVILPDTDAPTFRQSTSKTYMNNSNKDGDVARTACSGKFLVQARLEHGQPSALDR